MKIWLGAVMLMVAAANPFAQPRPAYFEFTTNDFWLNLHHYLYVLGRAHNGASDAMQPAVATAPDDEKQGLALLTDEERQIWVRAVDSYSRGLSQQSSFFQTPLAPMTIGLAKTGDVPSFPVLTWNAANRETLERAAPVYRKAWWPRHRAMNERYLAELRQRSIDRDGPAIVAFLSGVYRIGVAETALSETSVVAYSMWGGAFFYTGRLMIVSSNPNEQNDRLYPLEMVFHEGMHEWDDKVAALLRAQATTRSVTIPDRFVAYAGVRHHG